MSVTSSMYAGASGVINYGNAISVMANNIANVNTIGYKSDRALFADLMYQPTTNNSQFGTGVRLQKIDHVLLPGSVESTGNVSDLAISGEGFFRIDDGATELYTRAGAFRLDKDGRTLLTPDGKNVLDTAGANIVLAVAASKITNIRTDGTIEYLTTANVQSSHATKIGVATFLNPAALEKVSGTYFKETTDSGTPVTAGLAFGTAPVGNIFSGSLEQSNVDMAIEFVKLITVQRAYSANTKTISTADEMTQEVMNLKR